MSAAPDTIRGQIIAACAADIRMMGAKRMTILAVAAKLGMSHTNIYRFFAHKRALTDAVLNLWLRGLEVRLAEIIEGPDPADDKLERFLTTLTRAYAEALAQDEMVFRLLANPEPGAEEPTRHQKRVLDFLLRIIEEGMATRLFGGSDARRAAVLVLDVTHRFSNPATALQGLGDSVALAARRDRLIRWAVRIAISNQK